MMFQTNLLSLLFVLLIHGVSGRSGFFNQYFDRICKTLVASLPVVPNCGCTGGWNTLSGLNFNVNCTLEEPICIDPPDNNLCGTPSFVGQYSRRGAPSTTTLSIDAEGLLGTDVLDPPPLTVVLTHVRPVDYTNPIQFESCVAVVDDTTCNSCDVCENGKSFKFDCSNYKLLNIGFIQIAFPKVDDCIGLSDIPAPAPVSAPVASPV